MGRTPGGVPVECQEACDRESRLTLGLALGPPACAQDVLALLDATFRRTGGRSLMIAMNNGSIYTSDLVQDHLHRHPIVHRLNLSRMPQRNARMERGFGKLKEITELGQGVASEDVSAAAALLESAVHILDHARRRPVLSGKTAVECYRAGEKGCTIPDRENICLSVRDAQQSATADAPNARARRIAAREATFATLDRFACITRTRDGVPSRAVEREREA